MISEETLASLLMHFRTLHVDNSLSIIPLTNTFIPKDLIKAVKENPVPVMFLIGLYKGQLKGTPYAINVLLLPRDTIIIPKVLVQRVTDIMRASDYTLLPFPEEDYLKNFHAYTKYQEAANISKITTVLDRKFYKNHLDLLANEYYVVGSKKDHTVVGKLKKKLRRYRLRHLNEKKNFKMPLPKTQLGDDIRTLFSVLKLNKHVKRSRRKKINNALRKSSKKYREFLKANRIKKVLMEQDKAKRKQIRLKHKQERDQALYYLERLKTYEKACKGTDLNPLDLFFSHFENPK